MQRCPKRGAKVGQSPWLPTATFTTFTTITTIPTTPTFTTFGNIIFAQIF
jgi:hypothetical protein